MCLIWRKTPWPYRSEMERRRTLHVTALSSHGFAIQVHTCIEGTLDTLGWFLSWEKRIRYKGLLIVYRVRSFSCPGSTPVFGVFFPRTNVAWKGQTPHDGVEPGKLNERTHNRDQCKGAETSIDACAKLK